MSGQPRADPSDTLREHLKANLAALEQISCHPEDLPYVEACVVEAEGHAVAALDLLDNAEETTARVTTPSGFKLYKPARIVLDWTPGSNEPPAHGWPDPGLGDDSFPTVLRNPHQDERGLGRLP